MCYYIEVKQNVYGNGQNQWKYNSIIKCTPIYTYNILTIEKIQSTYIVDVSWKALL